MTKKIKSARSEKSVTRSTSRIKEVMNFTQTPSENQFDDHRTANDGIKANELFSYFTADIIKEEIVFTR